MSVLQANQKQSIKRRLKLYERRVKVLEYDGFLFGNGLSINLLYQIKDCIPQEKHYLLNIDDFLLSFIHNKLSSEEDNRIFYLFYDKCNIQNIKFYEQLKKCIAQYYETHNANIEYYLGVDLFRKKDCGYDYPAVKSFFPFLYNIWFDILQEFLKYQKVDLYISNFVNSIRTILKPNAGIYTTNFDRLMDKLSPYHLHGKFVKNFTKANELIFKYIDDEHFLYKCLWGWNGVGKLNFINDIRKTNGYETYFDVSFFFENDFHIKHLLVYGVGFQKSGYTEDLAKYKPIYSSPAIGGIIDEHILLRISGLQNQKQLENVTFSYYVDKELTYFQELAEYFNIKNVYFRKSTEFLFTIYH